MPTPRFSPWLRVLIFGVGAAIASVVLSTLVVVTMSVALVRAGRDAGAVQSLVGQYALWVNLLTYPTIWMWLVLCRRSYDKRPVRALGLRTHDMARALSTGALAGVVAVAWLCGLLWLCGGVQFNGWSPALSTLTPLATAGQLAFYVGMFAAVGFMEEAVFRGYVLHNFGAQLGLRTAIWLQAILFALIHLGNVGAGGSNATLQSQWFAALRAMPSLALIGAIFALCWSKSGTLWYSIGFHAAWNFALGCLFSLPVSGLQTFRLFEVSAIGNDWINGGSFGAEGSILLWPILLAMWLTLRRLPDHPQALHDLALLTQSAPQVLAAVESAPEPEIAPQIQSENEIRDENARQSRFQTSMRAAREADEDNIRDFPILGQLPVEAKIPSPEVAPIAPPETAPLETLPVESTPAAPMLSNTDFQFQPLPNLPEPKSESAVSKISGAESVNSAPQISQSEAKPEIENLDEPASKTVEVPSAAVQPRPRPRW